MKILNFFSWIALGWVPLWRSETCYSGQIIESETLSSLKLCLTLSFKVSFQTLSHFHPCAQILSLVHLQLSSLFCPLLSFIVHYCYLSSFIVIYQFLVFVVIQLSFELPIVYVKTLTILIRRERQSVSLILGEENPFKVRGTKMASGYDTPPGGVHIVQILRY